MRQRKTRANHTGSDIQKFVIVSIYLFLHVVVLPSSTFSSWPVVFFLVFVQPDMQLNIQQYRKLGIPYKNKSGL